MTPARPAQSLMRASDRDRELATRALRDAYAQGRLEMIEFLERTDVACSARTWGELAELTADLPEAGMFTPASLDASTYWELAEVRYEPRHPFAPLWWVAAAWLAVAVVAHVAAAIPLVLISLFLLRASFRLTTATRRSSRQRPYRPGGRGCR